MLPRGKKRPHFADNLGDEGDASDIPATKPKNATEAIVDTVLQEEDKTKEQMKSKRPKSKAAKGVAVEEVEAAEEDGVVLPSRVKKTREQRRKARSKADDTELLPDSEVAAVEEELQVLEDDGIQLEPFNLVQERAAGRFDESGHYIENRAKDDVTDAWLASEAAGEVSEAVKRAVAERERAMEAADAAPVMSTVQMAQLKGVLAEVLKPGETVTGGLKRLGATSGSGQRRPGKRAGSSGPPGKGPLPGERAAAATPLEQAAARADFNRLTEAASQLMDSGELDVYSLKQEDFAKAAALFARKPEIDAAEKDMFADDAAEDMFADSDAEKDDAKPLPEPSAVPSAAAAERAAAQPAAAASEAAAASTSAGQPVGASEAVAGARPVAGAAGPGRSDSSRAQAAEEVDYASWPVKELQRFLRERGQDPSGIVEKGDLVNRVKAAAEASDSSNAAVPPGYVYDAASKYYWSEDSRLYYDTASGGYFDGTTWYSWDGQQFVPYPSS